MEITVTEKAMEKIEGKIGAAKGFLKLKYDTEGCGCVVSGVAALWLVEELDEDDREVKTNARPIYVEKSKEIYLEEELKIDFSETANCFQLKSPNQYLNPRMSLLDMTRS